MLTYQERFNHCWVSYIMQVFYRAENIILSPNYQSKINLITILLIISIDFESMLSPPLIAVYDQMKVVDMTTKFYLKFYFISKLSPKLLNKMKSSVK